MNAYGEKIEIIQWIAGLDGKATLRQLRKIKEQSDVKLHEMNDLISEKEFESIQRGIDDSANGRVTPHSEIRKKFEKWL